MARRRDKTQAQTFQVVERVIERVDFELAAVTGTGVDLADRERTAELGARKSVNTFRQLGEPGLVGRGCRLGERPW